jgi:cytochrome c biogenesis protein CcdA
VKTLGTFLMAPLMVGFGVCAFVLGSMNHEGYSGLHWCLGIVAILLGGLIVAGLLNFAIFAPVYSLLGKLHSKKTQTKTEPRHDG